MPKVLTHKGRLNTSSLTKVFIAVPSYGDLAAGFVLSLFRTQEELIKQGINYELEIFSGNCHVDDSRNRLVRDFLETDCTDFFFLDADLKWSAKDFVNLLLTSKDVVAGTYPLKQDGDQTFPVIHKQGEIWADSEGLIEVENVPTGFLRIKRHVLEKMSDKAPGFPSKSDDEDRMLIPLIFERTLVNNVRWGGDYAFNQKWKSMGGKIYLNADMSFQHFGENSWEGNYGKHLKTSNDLIIPEILEKIKNKTETHEDIEDLFKVWGNEWAADFELLFTLIEVCRTLEGRVLEFGSGLSSLLMASANPDLKVYTCESDYVHYHNLKYKAKKYGVTNLEVILSPLEDGFYTNLPDGEFELLFCDGPPRIIGRQGFVEKGFYKAKGVIIMDDIDEEITSQLPIKFNLSGSKRFGIGVVQKETVT